MSSKEKHHGEDDQSLTTILNPDQRGELTLLIAGATASMRQAIESNFDATATLSSNLVEELTSEDDKIMNPNVDTGDVDVEQYDRERNLKEEREKELSAPKMKELKAACLHFFDDWRRGVIERVGEVVNSKETATTHMAGAHPSPSTTHSPSDKKIDPETPSTPSASASSLSTLYPPISTPLSSLPSERKILIVHSTLLLLLSLEHYISPSRILLLYMLSSLHLPLEVLAEDEEKVATNLLEAAKHMSGESETQKKVEENKDSRKWKVGLASVAGAAIIGITGGLAAPLVAAGVGSVMGGIGLGATAAAGYLGTVAGSTVIVGGLFGAYGGRMTGQMMDAYAREVEDFAFEPVRGNAQNLGEDEEEAAKKAVADSGSRRLRVTIGISGWLTEKDEVVKPWRVLGKGAEVFALRWELEALMNLGNSLTTMISSTAWGYAKSELIKHTIFAELMSAMWPIGLLKVSRVVDNPFSVAKSRADKTGSVLADALINKAQGQRPVTLVGYSLGARVIYSCLMSLAKRKAFGLIESVVFIGAPTPSSTTDWRVMRSVVAGRLVNVYSANDYVLGFLYRTSSIQYGVAGLQKIEGLPSVENVDVSETVSGHLRYRYLVGSILKKIGFEDIENQEVQREVEELKARDEEEEKRTYANKARKGLDIPDGDEKSGAAVGGPESEKQAEDMERTVKEKTQKSMMGWAQEQLARTGYGGKKDGGEAGGKAERDATTRDDGRREGADPSQMSYLQRATASLHLK
ncbi:hypothetical protein MMC12_005799 [Toensbergia leucococca]|nr:hypothetical protein [Toensbergia leucococca]